MRAQLFGLLRWMQRLACTAPYSAEWTAAGCAQMAYADEGVDELVKGVRHVAIKTPPRSAAAASSPG